MRILVSRLSSLGDVVCTLPAAGALKAGIPDAEIVWAVDARFRGIVELCKNVDHIVDWPRRPQAWRKAASELGEFDVALDLQGLLKSASVVALVRAGRKLGYHWRREFAWMFTQAVKPDRTSLHVVDQYVDVARAAGGVADAAEFGLVPNQADVARVRAMVVGDRLVICNAGAGWASKRWPAKSFAQLANRLAAAGATVAFIGAEPDRSVFDEVRGHGCGAAIDLIGKTSVKELVALVSLAKAHVGGDTGSSHIAAALGVPAISMYSVTRPERTGPYGQRHRALYDPRGLARIDVDSVYSAVIAAISA